MSEKKRARLDQLKNEIKGLDESTDIQTRAAISELITKCIQNLSNICLEKQRHTGSTEIAVANLKSFVSTTYEVICGNLKLSDVVSNEKTVNRIKYFCAKACARSAFEKHFEKSPDTLVLSNEKQNIILDTLDFTIAIHKTVTAARAHNQSAISKQQFLQLIIERVEYLQNKVQEIDSHLSTVYLNDYMNQAIQSIRPAPAITELTITSEETSQVEPVIPSGLSMEI